MNLRVDLLHDREPGAELLASVTLDRVPNIGERVYYRHYDYDVASVTTWLGEDGDKWIVILVNKR